MSLTAPDAASTTRRHRRHSSAEAAMPFLPWPSRSHSTRFGPCCRPEPLGVRCLAVRNRCRDRERKVFNSVLDSTARSPVPRILAASYDKLHLVPFGEYLPAQRLLERSALQQIVRQRGGFARAFDRAALDFDGAWKSSASDLYEVIFPMSPIADASGGLGSDHTNDGWFGNPSGPRQHYHSGRVRAVEWALPMLRASSNGISALIDARPRARAVELNAVGTLVSCASSSAADNLRSCWR